MDIDILVVDGLVEELRIVVPIDDVVVEQRDQIDARNAMLNDILANFNAYMRIIENDNAHIAQFVDVIKSYKMEAEESSINPIK